MGRLANGAQAEKCGDAVIPQSEWTWHGHAAHLSVRGRCRHHLTTVVGKYVISTLGDYVPDPRNAPDVRETIGSGNDDYYETMVWTLAGYCVEGCCPQIGNDLDDTKRYATALLANIGHLAMCLKYAAQQETA